MVYVLCVYTQYLTHTLYRTSIMLKLIIYNLRLAYCISILYRVSFTCPGDQTCGGFSFSGTVMSEAGEWWRALADVADNVRDVGIGYRMVPS